MGNKNDFNNFGNINNSNFNFINNGSTDEKQFDYKDLCTKKEKKKFSFYFIVSIVAIIADGIAIVGSIIDFIKWSFKSNSIIYNIMNFNADISPIYGFLFWILYGLFLFMFVIFIWAIFVQKTIGLCFSKKYGNLIRKGNVVFEIKTKNCPICEEYGYRKKLVVRDDELVCQNNDKHRWEFDYIKI